MQHERQHYVNGAWVDPIEPKLLDVIDPSTEEAFAQIAVGGPKDVDRAVAAARGAFPSFARFTRKQRLDLLKAMLAEYTKRRQDVADTLSQEMGAPKKLSYERQAAAGIGHLTRMIEVLSCSPLQAAGTENLCLSSKLFSMAATGQSRRHDHETTVDHALIRGLVTAGPVIRRRASSV